jgi:hypothetical protein
MVKVLGRFCIDSGLLLAGLVKWWIPLILIGLGIIFLKCYDNFYID